MSLKFGPALAAALCALALVKPFDEASAQAIPEPVSQAAQKIEPYVRPAPSGAPNIVLVLLDDVGFGAASTFGGVAQTPTLSALAKDGLRYNRFHTAAICSPTRAALMTGRNPHETGIGAVMNTSDSRPGYSGFQTKETATIAEILRQNGYATGAFGKWHQVPDWEASQAGPFDRWPTGEGFEKFYGFIGGETDQFEPTLYDGTTPIMRPPGDHYHLTEDLVDQTIKWIRNVRATSPEKPFFAYIPTGGTHAPIQAPKEYIARYRGKFDQGWDKLREETFAREKRLGVIPADAKLSPRPSALPAWNSLSADQKRVASRMMESYAGFLAHTDDQIGRVVQELKASGQYDNTLFIYIVGDNGASPEGGLNGSLNYMGHLQGLAESQEQDAKRIDQIGGRDSYTHYNVGWAWAMDAPFQWTKTVASHLGGTRNPMVITWPKRIKDKGGLRSQFGYVSDVTPTILEVTGIKAPDTVNGVKQEPITGISLAYTFDNKRAPERHTKQYFEVMGNRAIYSNGWMASARHVRVPWNASADAAPHPTSVENDVWELYDLRSDFSQANDLAKQYPDKLNALKEEFMQEAAANNVLPLSGTIFSKAGLPDPSEGRTEATYYSGTTGVAESALPHMANRSWTWEAVVTTKANARGVIAALGGKEAGLSFYVDEEHRPTFVYRLFDLKAAKLTGPGALSAGTHTLKVSFDYHGPGYGKGGDLSLSVDGKSVASDVLPASPPIMFSISETFAVGVDTGSPSGDYPKSAPIGFGISNADIDRVTITTH